MIRRLISHLRRRAAEWRVVAARLRELQDKDSMMAEKTESAWFYPETDTRFEGDVDLFPQTIEAQGEDLEARMQPITGAIIVRRVLAQVDDSQRAHNALHRLWTKAVGGDDYIKAEWLELERCVTRLGYLLEQRDDIAAERVSDTAKERPQRRRD